MSQDDLLDQTVLRIHQQMAALFPVDKEALYTEVKRSLPRILGEVEPSRSGGLRDRTDVGPDDTSQTSLCPCEPPDVGQSSRAFHHSMSIYNGILIF